MDSVKELYLQLEKATDPEQKKAILSLIEREEKSREYLARERGLYEPEPDESMDWFTEGST